MTEQPKPGNWYRGVRCVQCGTILFFADDPFQEAEVFPLPVKLDITCNNPKCGHRESYEPERVEWVLATYIH